MNSLLTGKNLCTNQEGQPFATNSCEVRGKRRGGKSIGSKYKTEFMGERRQTHITMQQWNPLFQMICAGHEQFVTGSSKAGLTNIHMVKFDSGSLHLCRKKEWHGAYTHSKYKDINLDSCQHGAYCFYVSPHMTLRTFIILIISDWGFWLYWAS